MTSNTSVTQLCNDIKFRIQSIVRSVDENDNLYNLDIRKALRKIQNTRIAEIFGL